MLWQERYGKGSWFESYEFERLIGKDRNDWRDKWTRHNITDGVFMLYLSIKVLGIAHVW
jgi:hypothetical protein